MKTLHLSIIVILIFSTLLYLKPIQADNTNGVEIQNIQTLPLAIIVGQTFKINATLVNNSSNPIFVGHGSCGAPFSVTFDNHVLVSANNINCTTELIVQKLNPGEKITATSPSLDLVYKATEAGTTNSTVTFQYEIWNQNNQSNSEETVSEPFSFTIHDNNTGTKTITETVLSPLQQFKSGITANEIQCKEDLQLVIKSSNGFPACVKPSSISRLVEIGWGTKTIKVQNTDFAIGYSIKEGELVNATANFDTNSLVLSVQRTSNGDLTVKLPRGLIDSVNNGRDEVFTVLVNDEKVDYKEQNTQDYRTLTFQLKSGTTQVQIVPYCPPMGCGG